MMKTYMNPYSEAVSTVQLSPFNESHWNRLPTKSFLSAEWMNSTMTNHQQRISLDRWRILGPIDINNLRAEDAQLLQELQNIRKINTIVPSLASAKEKKQRRQSKYSEEELQPRPTSPTEEYDRSSDFFSQTRETSLSQQPSTEKQFTFYSQVNFQRWNFLVFHFHSNRSVHHKQQMVVTRTHCHSSLVLHETIHQFELNCVNQHKHEKMF